MGILRARAALVGLVVGVPLSLVFLWLAVRNANLERVGSELSNANPWLIALAVASNGLVYVWQASRWRRIARTAHVSTARFAEMIVSGVAVNNILPGRIGDMLRVRWLQLSARIKGGTALSTVFVDRAFDVFALVVFIAVSLPFVASAEWLVRIAVGGAALLVALALILVAARLYTRRLARDRRSRGFVRRVARDTLEGLADPLGRRRGAMLAGLSLAAWGMWSIAAWLVARSLGIELSPIEALFVTGVINLGLAIPSSPGFIGTYQWLGVSALALLDVGTDRALAFAILMHAVWYVPTLLVGGGLLVRRGIGSVRSTTSQPLELGQASDGTPPLSHETRPPTIG
jgi:glycosyltransferase 2 family protein